MIDNKVLQENKKISSSLMQMITWPTTWIDQEVFLQFLRQRIKSEIEMTALCLDDLYLACACAHSVPLALQAFEEHVFSKIHSTVARSLKSTAAVDDLCQELRKRILVASDGKSARICEYAGTGRLIFWVRTIAMRMMVDQNRKKGALCLVSDQDLIVRALEPSTDPEATYRSYENNKYLKQAIMLAISKLSNEQHNLIRFHFIEGLNYARIARILGVHRSTVMRDLHQIQAQIRLDTLSYMQQHLKLRPAECESLMRAVDSQLGISLLRVLKEGLQESTV